MDDRHSDQGRPQGSLEESRHTPDPIRLSFQVAGAPPEVCGDHIRIKWTSKESQKFDLKFSAQCFEMGLIVLKPVDYAPVSVQVIVPWTQLTTISIFLPRDFHESSHSLGQKDDRTRSRSAAIYFSMTLRFGATTGTVN